MPVLGSLLPLLFFAFSPFSALGEPAGSKQKGLFVYASVRNTLPDPVDPSVFSDLFAARADGTGFRQLTKTPFTEEDPAWAPDGRLIAYSQGDGYCHADSCDWEPIAESIWLMNPDGSGQRPLLDPDRDDPYRGDLLDEYPSWSPDGKRIAFARSKSPGGRQTGIWVVGVDGEGLVRVSRPAASGLAWSPSGETIAYLRAANGHVMLVNLGTGLSRQLHIRLEGRRDPAIWALDWSPNGRFLALATGEAIYIVSATGGRARKVATARSTHDLSWSRDGCWLVFAAFRSGRNARADIYTVRAAGGKARRLTANRGDDFDPDWQL